MKVSLLSKIEEYDSFVNELNQSAEIRSILVIGAVNSSIYENLLEKKYNHINKVIWGGFFPAVFFEGKQYDDKVLVVGLRAPSRITYIEDLSESSDDFEDILESFEIDEERCQTALVFADTFSGKVEELVSSLFDVFGLDINYVGGGCGAIDYKQRPCIVSNQGLLENAAVINFSEVVSEVSISHGWSSAEGPFKVTRAEGNTVYEIDYRPAVDFYNEFILKKTNKPISEENFSVISRTYPFGIAKLGNEFVLRELMSFSKCSQGLEFIAEVPQNSFIHLMEGNVESVANSAKREVSQFVKGRSDKGSYFFFDCVSRVQYMEKESYDKNMCDTFSDVQSYLGALAIGEIANEGKDYLEFHNKTLLVCWYNDDK